MSSTDRQNNLLLSEDWKRIYQSFRNAEFQSYDFDNLRRTMINYLRQNYPEDFNDYIESSEYLALIDLIAFLGQNIAFRIDLNSRENFLELAERRESILRLARLVSYNPRRNQAANGLLKIDSISTTENIRDSNGLNLQGQTIIWNDPSNPDWNEHFERILNSALPFNNTLGNPIRDENINGVQTEQYRFRSINTDIPVFSYSRPIEGITTNFEVVSTQISNNDIQEEPPFPGNAFSFIFRNDGKGPSSSNTGYFLHFRQGILDQATFTVTNPSTSEVVGIDTRNINDSDVWLYGLDSQLNENELWTKVNSFQGTNVIYNSLTNDVRNIYSVLTRVDDRVNLVFSDGVFGNLPQGNFRTYYRVSRNQSFVVTPDSMQGVSLEIPYRSKSGRSEVLTITLSLKFTVDNASSTESNDSIRTNAPAQFYSQNRMVTAEDYQVLPLTSSQEIIKVKSVNRTSSGISRHFDLVDPTGKYSSTNLFGTDGAIYKEFLNTKTNFSFASKTDAEGAVFNTVEPILKDENLRNFYLDKFPRLNVEDLKSQWQEITQDLNLSTGFFENINGLSVGVGTFTESDMKFVRLNSLLKFRSPDGFHYLNGGLEPGEPDFRGGVNEKWAKVISVNRDGTNLREDGSGPVVLNDFVPSGSMLIEIKPPLANSLTDEVREQVVEQVFSFENFGLRFDRDRNEWRVITENNLDRLGDFSIGRTGSDTSQNLDSSWLLLFETDGEKYALTYRTLRYVFESNEQIRFFFDSSRKNFNNKTGKTEKDKITVLNINNQPDSNVPFNRDFDWEVAKEYRNNEGYVEPKKILLKFFDSDDDGIIDNPDVFEVLVNQEINIKDKLVFLQATESEQGVKNFVYVSKEDIGVKVFNKKEDLGPLTQYDDKDLFYYIKEDIFEIFDRETVSLNFTTNFKARVGRDSLKFQYLHSADQNNRIDPSASNIIDTYLLTRGYDSRFRLWLQDEINEKPLPPSSDNLFITFGRELEDIKSVSDEVIYHPVRYKVLFGRKANEELKATFKIVKNPGLVINDNDLKSRVIRSVNRFFALDNWEFGDTFYFSELSSFVVNELAPDLSSFVLVPNQDNQSFGSLYQIDSEPDEIFISGATVDDVEVIDSITADRLKVSGNFVTNTDSSNTGIQSSDNF